MDRILDIDAILAPIPGENPSGENMRYTPVYDQINEAKKEDDPHDRGEWQRELKTADWDKVVKIAVDALTQKTKDIQLTTWLIEGLAKTEGFAGVAEGLEVMIGMLQNFWEQLYPEIDDGDLDFRAAPLEYLSNRAWFIIHQIPLTDKKAGKGISYQQYQDSKQVGYEGEKPQEERNQLISQGKIPPEEFDSAVRSSSKAYYVALDESIELCKTHFKTLDVLVDEKFGRDAPRLAEFNQALLDCDDVVKKLLKEKREQEPDEVPQEEVQEDQSEDGQDTSTGEVDDSFEDMDVSGGEVTTMPVQISDTAAAEKSLWNNSLKILNKHGIKKALEPLLAASCAAPSLRGKHRFGLLMAKLCLKAQRPDLARPIIEQISALIEELQLNRWESPIWIAEVLDTHYQCLTSGETNDADLAKARELFQKMCTTDVTKAMSYKY